MNRRSFLGSMTSASAASLAGLAHADGLEQDQQPANAHQVQSSSTDGEVILDNGLLRVAFSKRRGEFAAQSATSSGVVELIEAGPTVQINGQELKARDATRSE